MHLHLWRDSSNVFLTIEIHLFEANPHFNSALVEAKERYLKKGKKINIYPSTVVGIKDGTQTLYLDTVNTDNDFWGSSTHADAPDALASQDKAVELTSVNLSRWLLMNTLPQDFVVIKMDIEGAEYEIIPHMAEMSAWTVVDFLLIEWHFRVLKEGGDPSEAKTKAAQKILIANGVRMPDYDSPA